MAQQKKSFNIPVYQRNYDWKREHCTRLFKDIEQIALHNFEIQHFIGTVVYVVSYAYPTYQELILIDGQQRITSITLLLKALYDVIEDSELKEDIYETYLINKRAPENLRVKLKPVDSDLQPYTNIIEGTESITGSSKIIRNFQLFKQLISESPVAPTDLYNALNNVELVYIQLDKDKRSENPQLIFESLNSTGLALTQGDLIRNFLLMNHQYDEQARLYKDYWLKMERLLTNTNISDFVRDYLTMKMSTIPAKDRVYDSFKAYALSYRDDKTEENLLQELTRFAKYYSYFIFCNSPDEEINNLLVQFRNLKSTTTYPTLLHVFDNFYELHSLDSNDLYKVLKCFITYLFRRLVCGYPTNALNKIFASLGNDIQKSSETSYYRKAMEILVRKTGSGTFPRDEEFKDQFTSRDFYKMKIDKYALYQLEAFQSKEVIDMTTDVSVEHIMPQKLTPTWQMDLGIRYDELHAKYLHTIGNLTLTAYNSNLSNRSFADKRIAYGNSNISISRHIADYEQWNEKSIIARANDMFSIAQQIWSLEPEYNTKMNTRTVDYSSEYNIMDDINVTGEKPKQLIALDMPYSVNSWKDVLRKLCDILYDLDSTLFMSLMFHKDFQGREKNLISDKADNMNSPYKIDEEVYIETNISANSIINYCRLLAEQYEISDSISFYLRPQTPVR